MERYLFAEQDLSEGFRFPQSFITVISEEPIIDLEPWWFFCEFRELADQWLKEVKKQYPHRELVPFAKVSDSDDIACFDGGDISGNPKIYYVHAYASSGWEDRGLANDFDEWLKNAQEESARYKEERAEDE